MAKRQPAERPETVDDAIAAIDKQFGKGAIMLLDSDVLGDVEVISTGSIALNKALGIGGYPRGRVVEVFGPEGSGKSTLALEAIAQAQKDDLVAAFIDAEHALSRDYATKVGVDASKLLFSQPDSGEQGLVIADMLVRSGKVGIVVIDSVAALVPQAEIDGTIGDQLPGAQARLMSQGLRVLTSSLGPGGPTVLFINQLREKIGVSWGNPETTPGGKALKYYASVRLDVRRAEALKDGAEIIGNRLKVKVVKNKLAPPLREAQFNLVFGEGIDKGAELLELGLAAEVIRKAGTWYFYGDTKLGMGRSAAARALVEQDLAGQVADVLDTLEHVPPEREGVPDGSREVGDPFEVSPGDNV